MGTRGTAEPSPGVNGRRFSIVTASGNMSIQATFSLTHELISAEPGATKSRHRAVDPSDRIECSTQLRDVLSPAACIHYVLLGSGAVGRTDDEAPVRKPDVDR